MLCCHRQKINSDSKKKYGFVNLHSPRDIQLYPKKTLYNPKKSKQPAPWLTRTFKNADTSKRNNFIVHSRHYGLLANKCPFLANLAFIKPVDRRVGNIHSFLFLGRTVIGCHLTLRRLLESFWSKQNFVVLLLFFFF